MTYDLAVRATTQKEADKCFKALVSECMALRKERGESCSRKVCEKIQRENIGYYSGYWPIEVQERVEILYKTVHPIFGSTSTKQGMKNREPENAFNLGQKMGAKARAFKQRRLTSAKTKKPAASNEIEI
jgi:hypothetical protein